MSQQDVVPGAHGVEHAAVDVDIAEDLERLAVAR